MLPSLLGSIAINYRAVPLLTKPYLASWPVILLLVGP